MHFTKYNILFTMHPFSSLIMKWPQEGPLVAVNGISDLHKFSPSCCAFSPESINLFPQFFFPFSIFAFTHNFFIKLLCLVGSCDYGEKTGCVYLMSTPLIITLNISCVIHYLHLYINSHIARFHKHTCIQYYILPVAGLLISRLLAAVGRVLNDQLGFNVPPCHGCENLPSCTGERKRKKKIRKCELHVLSSTRAAWMLNGDCPKN